jgi:hypothetical protein
MKVIYTQKTVAKVFAELTQDQFELELICSENLKKCGLKSVKVKLNDINDGDKEIVGHYFYPHKN